MADKIMESAVFHLNAIYPIRHPSIVNAVTIVPHPALPFITVHNTIVTPQNIMKETIRRYTLAPAKTSRIPRSRNRILSVFPLIGMVSAIPVFPINKSVPLRISSDISHSLLPLKVDSMHSYICDRCPCFGSLFPPLAALTFAASSIICAFGLASAAPRSPYRQLELCGIAINGRKNRRSRQ